MDTVEELQPLEVRVTAVGRRTDLAFDDDAERIRPTFREMLSVFMLNVLWLGVSQYGLLLCLKYFVHYQNKGTGQYKFPFETLAIASLLPFLLTVSWLVGQKYRRESVISAYLFGSSAVVSAAHRVLRSSLTVPWLLQEISGFGAHDFLLLMIPTIGSQMSLFYAVAHEQLSLLAVVRVLLSFVASHLIMLALQLTLLQLDSVWLALVNHIRLRNSATSVCSARTFM